MTYFKDRYKSLPKEQQFWHTELVRYGVDYHQAAKVAKILAEKKPDELLSEEEIRLTKEVCEAWLRQRNRLASISRALE
ncbi:hypothetical protein [Nostoc sp. 106C]|jgi:hypothetical protein|uniref:hypothetical protein n=1 Tax=Nostoc sp. 106C TaxID=1932667 RepID=UPI000A3AA1F6|nr:hypothetical protein [Nostoc sp. 106C]OUL18216.1 hypothetical protein BV375_34140 [Nostoc sp. 106C]OUL24400.1 hypothetical protein BV378_18605 [Nostoc sp. RF31YmG]